MKKLKLDLQHFENAEVLTRSQLKNILGGDPPATTLGSCTVTVTCPESMPGTVSCSSAVGKCQKGTLYVQCDKDAEIWC